MDIFEVIKKDETKALEVCFKHVRVISYFFYNKGALKAFIEDVRDNSLISLEDKRLLSLMHFDLCNWLTNFTKPIKHLVEINLVSLESIFKPREVTNDNETDTDERRSQVSHAENILHGVSLQTGPSV